MVRPTPAGCLASNFAADTPETRGFVCSARVLPTWQPVSVGSQGSAPGGCEFCLVFGACDGCFGVPLRARRSPADRLRCIAHERTAFVWHGFLLNVQARAALRLSRRGPMGTREGPPLQREKSAGRSVYRSDLWASVDWKAPIFPYDLESGDGTCRAGMTATAPPACRRKAWSWSIVSTGAMTVRSADAARGLGDLRDPRQGLFPRGIGMFQSSCAEPTRDWRTRRASTI